MSAAQIVVWVYIVLLMAGGMIGFLKAGSKASLVASSIFAAVLVLFALNILPFTSSWVVVLVLLLFFGNRFRKSKKFMPGGLMAVITLLTLLLLFWV